MGQISTTSQLLGSLGVNVHVEYTDGKYASASNVIADLSYLGITHVRDAVLNPSNQGQYNYDALAAAGIKFDFFFQGNDLTSTMSLVDAFVSRHPGAVSLIEGPNEVNNFPISYNGQTGNAAALSYQAALYAAVHSDGSLSGVPVANLTSWPDLVGPADLANYHPYPKGGASPGAPLLTEGQAEIAAEGGRPLVMTEGGYSTLLNGSYTDGIDELTQAKYTLDIFLDNAKAGVSSSYIYELLDAYADPTNSDPEKHYGLFHLDNTPKLAATAIHDLTTILSAGTDGSVAPSALTFSTSGLPSTASTLTLTKSTGVHDLVLWNEPTIWNAATEQEIGAASAPVTIHLGALSDVTVYDPLHSAVAVQTLHDVQDVTLTLSDHPLIVEVKDLPPSAPIVPPLATVILPDGSVQTTTLNADGTTLKHVTGISGQSYVSSDSVYSANNALVSIARFDSAGATLEADSYAADGSYVAHVTGPAGASYASSDNSYNSAGVLTSRTTYNAAGKTLEVDAYDVSGAISNRKLYAADGSVSESDVYGVDGGYDVHLSNRSGYAAVDYIVNSSGQLASQTTRSVGGQLVTSTYSYSADGSITQHVVDSSSSYLGVDYLLNSGGKVLAVYAHNPDGSYTAHLLDDPVYETVDYTVDPLGKLTSETAKTVSGRVVASTYSYGTNGSVTQHIVDSSSTYSAVDYVFDATGKVSAVYAHSRDGSYTAQLLDNPNYSTLDYTVDTSGKLTSQTAHYADGRIQTWCYSYSDDGSVTQHITDSNSSYSEVDYVFDPSGKISALYAHSADGSYTAHLFEDSGHSEVEYTVGANGVLQTQILTNSSGTETVQMYDSGSSATSDKEDETFELFGSHQQVVLSASFGHVTVSGFAPGDDTLTLSSSFSGELLASLKNASDDNHGNTLITLDSQDSILLMGVSSTAVHAHLSDYHLAA